MKVTITEVRQANFIHPQRMDGRCRIEYTYEVSSDNGDFKSFHTLESAEGYVKYLQERENDYKKVIKEVEI